MEDPIFANSDLFATGGDSSDDEDISPDRPCFNSHPRSSQKNKDTPTSPTPPPSGIENKPKRKTRERNRMTKSDVKRMHSESQRLIRESDIKLPHYQPKLKTLDSFLSKINAKSSNGSKTVLKKAMPKVTSLKDIDKSHDLMSHDNKENINKEEEMTTSNDINNECTTTCVNTSNGDVTPPHSPPISSAITLPTPPLSAEPLPSLSITTNTASTNDSSSHTPLSTDIITSDSNTTPSSSTSTSLSSNHTSPSINTTTTIIRDFTTCASSKSNSLSSPPHTDSGTTTNNDDTILTKPTSEAITVHQTMPTSFFPPISVATPTSIVAHTSEARVSSTIKATPSSLTPPITSTSSNQMSLTSFFQAPLVHSQVTTPRLPTPPPAPPPLLSLAENWSEEVITLPELTPVQELQRRFLKQITPLSRKQTAQQLDNRPGAAWEKLRSELQQKLSSQRAEERKKIEEEEKERREEEEEIVEEEEEAEFSDLSSECDDDDDEKSEQEKEEEEEEEGQEKEEIDNENKVHKIRNDDEETLFVPIRKSRLVLSDDDDDDIITNHNDVITSHNDDINKEITIDINCENDTKLEENSIATNDDAKTISDDVIMTNNDITSKQNTVLEDEASMGPLIFNESSQDSELFEEKRENTPLMTDQTDFDTSSTFTFPLCQSIPPYQLTKQTSSDSFILPDLLRNNSTISSISDKEDEEEKELLINEDTQFLDSEGFLCFRDKRSSINNKVKQLLPSLKDPSFTQVQALCSGSFLTNSEGGVNHTQSDDIMGLCSGVFPNTAVPTQVTTSTSSESEEEEEMPTLNRKKKHFPLIKGDGLKDYVESEAELSGSDIGSDEEEDEEEVGGESYDEGAGSDVPLSESELWDQVNQAHIKQLADDDKADLRDIKERFLVEGDLYEDGLHMKNGFFRSRHFAHAGSETSMDLFANNERDKEIDEEDEEGGVIPSQVEAKKRRERLEKEEFIRKCQENSNLLNCDEDSQSILGLIKESSLPSILKTPEVSSSAIEPLSHSSSSSSSFNKRTRCGSFLKHNPSTLQRLSSLTSTTSSLPGSGRSFVFKTGPGSTPLSTNSTSKTKSIHKRPRLDRSVSLPNSTFISNNNKSIFDQL